MIVFASVIKMGPRSATFVPPPAPSVGSLSVPSAVRNYLIHTKNARVVDIEIRAVIDNLRQWIINLDYAKAVVV